MNNPTVTFHPYASADPRNIVQSIVANHNVAFTGEAEWYPVAFFLRDENGEVLGGLLGDIWAGWLHVRTLAVVAPARGHGFGNKQNEGHKQNEGQVKKSVPREAMSACLGMRWIFRFPWSTATI